MPGLDAKVAFLREAASYPESTYRVEAIETHMSWVFMLDDYVYKLKKPVRYELLDFRALAARRFYCEEELRLNLRLAPDVYLGLVPLTVDRHRHLELAGGGAVVDWLVRMRRLPAEKMLDYALLHHALPEGDLLRLSKHLAAFYLALRPEPVTIEHYRARFTRLVAAVAEQLLDDEFELPGALVEAVARAQHAVLRRIGALLDQRVHAGKIIEGHGDLRPEHVYLGVPLAVIDCLEFSRKLRIADVADELGFLALECERLGAGATGVALLHSYSLLSGDNPPAVLIHFYQSCRASMRSLIAARHLLDEKFRHSPHWLRRARLYLQLAEEHIGQCG